MVAGRKALSILAPGMLFHAAKHEQTNSMRQRVGAFFLDETQTVNVAFADD